MDCLKENVDEAFFLKGFRHKLEMSRVNVMNRFTSQVKRDEMKYYLGEFDMSSLPLLVKKHIITTGIIRGYIFQCGDGFGCIKEGIAPEGGPATGKTLHLQVRALTAKSYEMAIRVVEALIDEVLEPQKKFKMKAIGHPSWNQLLNNEFEIQDLVKPVISHLITKGIIKGELYQATGAVVFAQGSPYIAEDYPQGDRSERPLYLMIQGPNDKTLYWARQRIERLIKEAEEKLNKDVPSIVKDLPSESLSSHEPMQIPNVTTAEVTTVGQKLKPEGSTSTPYPTFMPALGRTVEADVERCTMLVQWLLAHPIIVSFLVCPPKNCESKRVSKEMIIAALLCLPLYVQYKCSTHSTSNMVCDGCFKFFTDAQKSIDRCFGAVIHSGYDISKLECVDNYIKNLASDPNLIGVLYDYPLPLTMFYIDNCRLFIDLVVNCGLYIPGPTIASYLRCTKQWYSICPEFKTVVIKSEVKPCPSNNPKTHHYPAYDSSKHPGALVNFHPKTISEAVPGQLFFADASRIPRCQYFPFISQLSLFSNLHKLDRNNKTQKSPNALTDTSSTVKVARLARKERRKEERKRKLEEEIGKKEDIDKAKLRENHGTNNFWTMDPHVLQEKIMKEKQENVLVIQNDLLNPHGISCTGIPPQTGPLVPQSAQLELINMQRSMPAIQPSMLSAKPFITGGQDSNSFLRPAVLDAEKILGSKQPKDDDKVGSEPDPWYDVISKLEENTFWKIQNTPKRPTIQLSKEEKSEEIEQKPHDIQDHNSGMPSPFLSMQELKEKPKNIPQTSNSTRNPHKKQLRKLKAEKKKEQKREEINKTIETLKEKYGTNSFWTIDTSVLEAKTVKETLENFLGEKRNLFNLQSSSQPQTSCLPFTTSLDNLQQELTKSQMSMAAGQSCLIGTQPQISLRNENNYILKPARLIAEQVLKHKELVTNDWKVSQNSSQSDEFSKVIRELQEYIQSSEGAAAEEGGNFPVASQLSASPQQPPDSVAPGASSTDSTSASSNSDQCSGYSDIIQQLQQFIESNEQTTPQNDSEKETSNNPGKEKLPADVFKKPSVPVASTTRKEAEKTSEVVSSGVKRTATEPTSQLVPPKRVHTENSSAKTTGASTSATTQNPGSSTQKPGLEKGPTATKKSYPIRSLEDPTNIMSSVSILGDSLLKRARAQFGGSGKLHQVVDIMDDNYNIRKLTEDVARFLKKGGRLRPNCLIMCGANNIVQKTPISSFSRQLKTLLNLLTNKNYYVFLVSLPMVISTDSDVNKNIPSYNGLFVSYQTKEKVSIIQFHKIFKDIEEKGSIFESVINLGRDFHHKHVVLSKLSCKLIQELVEKEFLPLT